MNIILGILFIIILFIFVMVRKRGYFWKDKSGKKLTFKEFILKWKEGILETTPLQQTKIVLFSFFPLFAGIIWGLVVTYLGRTYWLSLILLGSLPITSMQFLSNIQKYISLKRVNEVIKKLNKK